ncbi:MAG: hypothetical protein WKG06_08175 [Segetibacter sp.]
MGLIKEPKNIDLIINSKPWTEEELAEFGLIIQKRKEAKAKKNSKVSKTLKKRHRV